jgi:hypothetical protein
MIKNLIAIFSILMVTGCAPAKAPPVSMQSCDKVYGHVLDLTAQSVMEQIQINLLFDKRSEETIWTQLMSQIDAVYQKRGSTKQFYAFCTQHMTEQQVTCSVAAKTLDDVNVCMGKAMTPPPASSR